MGIDNPSSGGSGGTTGGSNTSPVFDADAAGRYAESYPNIGMFPNVRTYSTNQFYGLTDVEPYSIERKNFDNPRFLFPKDSYIDVTGEEKVIQRGYMRSLISDPAVDINGDMKNRRLFFQFNPEYLVRSVQQSVGSMLPLLQDPAQLTQPVPGTTSFGFQLLFNREHEVNASYNDPQITDWLMLPSGQKALVSEIGVLADLMILDSITGQGLSQDMVNSVINIQKRRDAYTNAKYEEIRSDMEEAGIDQETLDYQPIPEIDEDNVSEIFAANLGNSAFLNPLPFRVLFSSLFMVEGIATSIEVKFTKFSRTMVPTMCTVTINMYALYFGFAKKETFIFDNLVQTAQDAEESTQVDDEVLRHLASAVESFDGYLYHADSDNYPSDSSPQFIVTNIKIGDQFKEYISKSYVKEVNFSFSIDYYFGNGNTVKPSDETLQNNKIGLLQNGKKADFNAKGTKKVEGLSAGTIFKDEKYTPISGSLGRDYDNPYFSFRVILTVHAVSTKGNTVSFECPGSVVYHVDWWQLDTGNKSDKSSYRYTAKTQSRIGNIGEK